MVPALYVCWCICGGCHYGWCSSCWACSCSLFLACSCWRFCKVWMTWGSAYRSIAGKFARCWSQHWCCKGGWIICFFVICELSLVLGVSLSVQAFLSFYVEAEECVVVFILNNPKPVDCRQCVFQRLISSLSWSLLTMLSKNLRMRLLMMPISDLVGLISVHRRGFSRVICDLSGSGLLQLGESICLVAKAVICSLSGSGMRYAWRVDLPSRQGKAAHTATSARHATFVLRKG